MEEQGTQTPGVPAKKKFRRRYSVDPRTPSGVWNIFHGRYFHRNKFDAPWWFVLAFHAAQIALASLLLRYCGVSILGAP